MNRWTLRIGLAALVIAGFVAQGHGEDKPEATPNAFQGDAGSKAYTHLHFREDPGEFRFAVIGDRTGGTRAGVFTTAVDLVNLLQPRFVMSVGDLIEGYVEDEATLKSMWAEVDSDLRHLEMPLFFVTGNHDVNMAPSEQVWFDRVGAKRGYSHFVYKDVLFLTLSTEDPPKQDPGPELSEKYERAKSGQVSPQEAREIVAELEAWAGAVNISDAQVKYFRRVLAENSEVRWTFAFMHTPAWDQPDPGNFAKIEAMLANRPYTVFAGHTHTYDYKLRKGRDYITMGLTGGLAPAAATQGNMDHVALVTVTKDGPVIGNLLLNGILDKRGATPSMMDYLLARPRQVTQTGRSLGIKSIPNLRDLGGYRTRDGATVASGLVYRANQFHDVSQDDMKKLAGLGLKSAFDLRTHEERSLRPGELPPEVDYVWLDVLADAAEANPAVLEKLLSDPQAANEQLGDGKAEAGFADSYRQFVALPSARHEFRKLFLCLADETHVPALFHCTTGKDRTGWAAAALLTLLGVPRETVFKDYLRSNENILPMYQKVIDAFVEAGGDEEIPLAILGVKREYLQAAFDEMEKRHGTIEKYFSDGLGLDGSEQDALRKLYLHR